MLPKLTAKEWGAVPYSFTVFARIHFPPTKHTPTHAINGRNPLFTSRLFWGWGEGYARDDRCALIYVPSRLCTEPSVRWWYVSCMHQIPNTPSFASHILW